MESELISNQSTSDDSDPDSIFRINIPFVVKHLSLSREGKHKHLTQMKGYAIGRHGFPFPASSIFINFPPSFHIFFLCMAGKLLRLTGKKVAHVDDYQFVTNRRRQGLSPANPGKTRSRGVCLLCVFFRMNKLVSRDRVWCNSSHHFPPHIMSWRSLLFRLFTRLWFINTL